MAATPGRLVKFSASFPALSFKLARAAPARAFSVYNAPHNAIVAGCAEESPARYNLRSRMDHKNVYSFVFPRRGSFTARLSRLRRDFLSPLVIIRLSYLVLVD